MATITPAVTSFYGGTLVTWAGAATGDTLVPYEAPRTLPLGGAVEFAGTITTASIHRSNAGTNYYACKEDGADIAFTAPGMAEISTGARFIKPVVTGTGITITLALRG